MTVEQAAAEQGEGSEADESTLPTRIRRKRRWSMDYLPDEVNCVLRDYDAGMNAKEIGKRHGVSKATLYRWIAQFEDQRTVDDDPGSMRMRIAVLEKTVLHLSTANAELRAAATGEVEGGSADASHTTSHGPSPMAEVVDAAS